MPYDLIIFDCDGTLVDSERLYNTIASELLTEVGLPQYTPEACFKQFSGHSWKTMLGILEERHNVVVPVEIVQRFVGTAKARIERDLKPVAHVHAVLEKIAAQYKICVASNGEHSTVLKSLAVTGLDEFFAVEHIFSKIMVERPKPAPDIFLHAAQQMGVEPRKCLVIEDSVAGVRAGVAAGMHTIGFYGTALDGAEHREDQIAAGAHHTIRLLTHVCDFLKS